MKREELSILPNNKLISTIKKFKKKHNAIILAHNYQRDEIQEVADICGDSLGLSIEASKTDAEVIVFCGVHFMAESASILSPQKTVILPRIDAGCPLADMVDVPRLKKKKEELENIPVVCYVNSSAAVKAESDICCTSANAIKVVSSLNDADKVLMIPDRNLAFYTSKFTSKEIIPWEGFCPTHHLLKVEDVQKAKTEHPNALFIAHPECTPEILKYADHVCSTSGMYRFAKETSEKELIIGTEEGILYRLKKENPDKKFYLPAEHVLCPNMKLTRLEDIAVSLETLEPVVKVPEEIRVKAYQALKRMIGIPRD
ncbi:MAG: quinolinate synthase [Candidatus Schekmanbacteria bacterium RIFCSPHIGHO2_02_FULL_38_11]|uniref:Quinolinate synthase n=1 Tax=Candidatus Schekmanbacteria bacterium RIFCSPLOWO2_12_FULL_38_15 TaxID=1817883 RepID=A0A1F7SIC1_9BACT|nr:MAG: quinolinate synthase [Candidatus Schekmanbacteria bacterium GWA2_38_9]OGL49611.1 MAG: quinolinate synthase [Candidatus Schekmanbacteria bacterium RIFCSPLOWO2_02_FULL_38_14]OGL50334.1 MAG: quinolinate synthase [Candidatus Schekmanbacteria bacterium RIFCSPHIGHO2_02_FULL_38_11]OGL52964.1 MAG: quinolinate synthase [Candidatus Schekmanbacteria bacterium RIFCSPLOWO2_12_FULL_38_15]